MKIDGCGSLNGRVFVWLRDDSTTGGNKKLIVNNMTALRDLLDKFIGADAAELVNQVRNH